MSISALPTPPSLTDSQDTYSQKALAFLGALPTLQTEINTEVDRINQLAFGSFSANSTSSLTIGTGSKSLTIESGKGFVIGQPVLIASTAAPSNYMTGQVTSYNSSTGALVVNVTAIGGSGTVASWAISITSIAASIALPNYYKNKITNTSTTSFVVPAGVSTVRAYAVGSGGNGGPAVNASSTNGSTVYCSCGTGGGGGMAWGDIAVNAGDTLTIDITSGVAKVIKGGITLLQGNNGTNGSSVTTNTTPTGGAGGTAVKDASVTNGGTCSGANGSGYNSGGGAGIPTGVPISISQALNSSGSRSIRQKYSDPLLSEANGSSGIAIYIDAAHPAIETSKAENGGRGADFSSSQYYVSSVTGSNGSDFGSGGNATSNQSTQGYYPYATGGVGGFLGAGGYGRAQYSGQGNPVSATSYGGAGGNGAGGGGAYSSSYASDSGATANVSATGGTGGAAAVVLMY
jgi:hypothetical protein